MKKFVLGALAALSSIGLYKLHKEGKLHVPVLKIKGTVNAVDYENRSFQIRSSLDRNILMDVSVMPDTHFMWLNPVSGMENMAQFADVSEGEKLGVSFVKNKENGKIDSLFHLLRWQTNVLNRIVEFVFI